MTFRSALPFVVAAVIAGGLAIGAVQRYAGAVHPVWLWLAAVNAGTAVLYSYDKAAARWRVRRVPEAVLHGLTLLGGTPAAVMYQRILRHKTQKASFRRWFIAIVVAQMAVVLAVLGR